MNYTNAAILNMLGKITDGLTWDDKDDEDCIEDTLEYIDSCVKAIREEDIIPEPNFDDEEDIDNSCIHCVGTGISPTRTVDDKCNHCDGSGYLSK